MILRCILRAYGFHGTTSIPYRSPMWFSHAIPVLSCSNGLLSKLKSPLTSFLHHYHRQMLPGLFPSWCLGMCPDHTLDSASTVRMDLTVTSLVPLCYLKLLYLAGAQSPKSRDSQGPPYSQPYTVFPTEGLRPNCPILETPHFTETL